MFSISGRRKKMNISVVLAMHGAPPRDFPKKEMMELFGLHLRLTVAGEDDRAAIKQRHDELEDKMRRWPRTPKNDPFYAASLEMAQRLAGILQSEVFVGFNEFCAPAIEEALERAVKTSPDKIIVVTPMMTRGGEHSEKDIPETLRRAQRRYPDIKIVYAWPYDVREVARFLSEHIKNFL
jgi:sirohydrochlorin cobaltochelatase